MTLHIAYPLEPYGLYIHLLYVCFVKRGCFKWAPLPRPGVPFHSIIAGVPGAGAHAYVHATCAIPKIHSHIPQNKIIETSNKNTGEGQKSINDIMSFYGGAMSWLDYAIIFELVIIFLSDLFVIHNSYTHWGEKRYPRNQNL